MMDALAYAEQTAISQFMREDFYAYFVALIGHAFGMALLVGGGLASCLRLLGLARRIPVERLPALYPVMRLGAVLAVLSGAALLAGYPAKALTNWVFAAKFAFLASAIGLMVLAQRRAVRREDAGAKGLALLALLGWIGTIAAGKLLLYTNVMLLTSDAGM